MGRARRRRRARARRRLPLPDHAPAPGPQRRLPAVRAPRHDAAAPARAVDRPDSSSGPAARAAARAGAAARRRSASTRPGQGSGCPALQARRPGARAWSSSACLATAPPRRAGTGAQSGRGLAGQLPRRPRVARPGGQHRARPALDDRGLPAAGYGRRLPGRGGITVRYLGVQPPLARRGGSGRRPSPSTRAASAGAGASAGRLLARRRSGLTHRGGALRLRARARVRRLPARGPHAGHRRTTVPFAVQGRAPRGARRPADDDLAGPQPVDDDGDGAPTCSTAASGARLGPRLRRRRAARRLRQREAPLLAWLARTGRRFDVTTDVALAQGRGPPLRATAGVLLPATRAGCPRRLQQRLRRFVRRGGPVVDARDRLAAPPGARHAARRLDDPTPPRRPTCSASRCPARARAGRPLTTSDDQIGSSRARTGRSTACGAFEPVAGCAAPRRLAATR